jgi:hypothetical protein
MGRPCVLVNQRTMPHKSTSWQTNYEQYTPVGVVCIQRVSAARARDKQDGQVGKVGCEINFNRYFYTYTPPRPLREIEADIRALEGEIMAMLRDLQDGDDMLS